VIVADVSLDNPDQTRQGVGKPCETRLGSFSESHEAGLRPLLGLEEFIDPGSRVDVVPGQYFQLRLDAFKPLPDLFLSPPS